MSADTQVLIVGAGPVGLTLAIALGRRGVRCTVVERNEAPLGYPKMERCNPRTMEIFRRLGLSETIRAAGYPDDWPMDNYLVFTLSKGPLMKFSFPTVREAQARTATVNDGTLPLEPYQIISQYTLEPLLKSAAEAMSNVTVRFGVELETLSQKEDGVDAVLRSVRGQISKLKCEYLVGCDGGGSVVRKHLGFELEGESILKMHQGLFRCDDLFDRVPAPRGRHYHRVDKQWTFLIVQDSTRHFTVHSVVENESQMPAMFETIVGTPVNYETLHVGSWTQRLMLATGYYQNRVFLAGDSCHLVIPTGGLGYNTGVGDAIDLAWKLAAVLQGWGGPKLLPSYQFERRQVGERNVAASRLGNTGRKVWREAYRPWIEEDTPDGAEARKYLLEVSGKEAQKSSSVVGAELGYRYVDSPIIYREAGEGPPQLVETYHPTTWPGARLPHVWMRPGVSVHDCIEDGYTLLRAGRARDDVAKLRSAFRELYVPFNTLDIPDGPARDVYGYDYLLIRPDLHVVWRGNTLPDEPGRLARLVTGH